MSDSKESFSPPLWSFRGKFQPLSSRPLLGATRTQPTRRRARRKKVTFGSKMGGPSCKKMGRRDSRLLLLLPFPEKPIMIRQAVRSVARSGSSFVVWKKRYFLLTRGRSFGWKPLLSMTSWASVYLERLAKPRRLKRTIFCLWLLFRTDRASFWLSRLRQKNEVEKKFGKRVWLPNNWIFERSKNASI